jgi:hypothetical protein
MVAHNMRGLIPSKIDPEFCFGWGDAEFTCIMTKHVHDLKVAGKSDFVQFVLAEIQQVFGELKVLWKDFTNCGARHLQDTVTKEITLDQIAQNLNNIAHLEPGAANNEDQYSPQLHQLYMSLLGTVAYLAHARVDALVFVRALQRPNS